MDMNEGAGTNNWVVLTDYGRILYGTSQGESKDEAMSHSAPHPIEDRVAIQGEMNWTLGRVDGINLKDGRFLPMDPVSHLVDLQKVAEKVFYYGYGSAGEVDESLLRKMIRNVLLESKEHIVGGLASHRSINDIAKRHDVSTDIIKAQIKKGIKVEMEHTTDPDVAREIAMDHLMEDPAYYDKLEKVEGK